MTRKEWLLPLAGLTAGLLISSRFGLLAQDRPATTRPDAIPSARRIPIRLPKQRPSRAGSMNER